MDEIIENHHNSISRSEYTNDQDIMKQKEDILDSVRKNQALIASKQPVMILLEDLQHSNEASTDDSYKIFKFNLENIQKQYPLIRRVRGDGNCFYRSFLFSFLSMLVSAGDKSDIQKAISIIQISKDKLMNLGYSESAIEIFWECMVEYLEKILHEEKDEDELEKDFQEENGEAEYMVWYCRLLTSGYIKENPDRFQPFIDGMYPGHTIEQFCASEVEPMAKECEQIQIIALTEALGAHVKIVYLDSRSRGKGNPIQVHDFPEESKRISCSSNAITLLYRPGHYDILYFK